MEHLAFGTLLTLLLKNPKLSSEVSGHFKVW
jgi:hypothetical protein